MDFASLDYFWATRAWAQASQSLTAAIVPTQYQTNPAFVYYMWMLRWTENLTMEELKRLLVNFPRNYEIWWKNLYEEAPVHIFIETCMVIWIFWLLFIRKTADPKIKEKDSRLSDKEVKWLVDTWKPEPLVPKLSDSQMAQIDAVPVVEGISGDNNEYLKVEGIKQPVHNLSSYDYLGRSSSDGVKSKIEAALNKYGCGSCGPRGFYGTIDVHLQFESTIADFMGVEEAIAYSDSASGVSSTISAFAKRGDLVIFDEACNEAIRTGVNLSRATVRTFKHNDTNDLRMILEGIAAEDKKKRRDATQQRRFIITEGLFRNSGEIAPLKNILALKDKFAYRLVLDESHAFGTLGETGRGTTEHFGVPITEVEIITIAMDNALASVGGVTLGSHEVVDHQRLSGPGYCFSASACPFLSAGATQALVEIKEQPELVDMLRANSKKLAAGAAKITGLKVKGKEFQTESPIVHLIVDPALGFSKAQEKDIIVAIAKKSTQLGTGISACKFSLTDIVETCAPSVRLTASAYLTDAQLKAAFKNIALATKEVLKKTKDA